MRVQELMEALQKCDPERIATFIGHGGVRTEITHVVQESVGGMGTRFSFQYVKVVDLCQASPGHLQKQGFEVVAEVRANTDPFDGTFDFERRPTEPGALLTKDDLLPWRQGILAINASDEGDFEDFKPDAQARILSEGGGTFLMTSGRHEWCTFHVPAPAKRTEMANE